MDPLTQSLVNRYADAYVAVHSIRGLTVEEQDALMFGHESVFKELTARFRNRETLFAVVSAAIAYRLTEVDPS